MKAIIEVNVPDFQIGQEVSIYFKDTMMIKGIVQEPKTGHWIYIRNSEVNGLKIVECSECGKRTYGSGNYCPNCGARMRGDAE